jgi:hypothetical protein
MFTSDDSTPWRWRHNAPPKRRYTCTRLLGATTKKSGVFILAAVRTPNITKIHECYILQFLWTRTITRMEAQYYKILNVEVELETCGLWSFEPPATCVSSYMRILRAYILYPKTNTHNNKGYSLTSASKYARDLELLVREVVTKRNARFGNGLQHLLTIKTSSLYGVDSRNYKYAIIQFSETFLYIIHSCKGSECFQFAKWAHNLQVS